MIQEEKKSLERVKQELEEERRGDERGGPRPRWGHSPTKRVQNEWCKGKCKTTEMSLERTALHRLRALKPIEDLALSVGVQFRSSLALLGP